MCSRMACNLKNNDEEEKFPPLALGDFSKRQRENCFREEEVATRLKRQKEGNFDVCEGEYEVVMGLDEGGNGGSIIFRDAVARLKEQYRYVDNDEERRRSEYLGALLDKKARRRRDTCCIKCQEMTGTLEGLRSLVEDGYRHYSYYQLRQSADMGCKLCELIWDLTEHDDWERDWVFEDDEASELTMVTDEKIIVRAVNNEAFNNDGSSRSTSPEACDWRNGALPLGGTTGDPLHELQLSTLKVMIPFDGGVSPNCPLLHLVTSEDNPAAKYVPGRRQGKELTSAAVNVIHDWLEECHDKHKFCPKHLVRELPRRVVDVGRQGEVSLPRLHISKPGEKGEYAALSYCWGEDPQTMTTAATLSTYIQCLPSNLSNSISDAITVCRKLGVRYLWVDALCIIQDDETDKAGQLSSMGTIYKQALFTIAAAGVAQASDSFLKGKGSNFDPTFAHLPFFVDDSICGEVQIIEHGFRDVVPEDSQPLFSRGWTLQEMLLSPRLLIFDTNQLLLKCGELRFKPVQTTYLSYEDYSCPDMPSAVLGEPNDDTSLGTWGSKSMTRREEMQASTWAALVKEYSRRDLSFMSDRLPALAGVVAELSNSWGDRYVVGFWESSIIQHLAWSTNKYGGFDRKTTFKGVNYDKPTGSPSWSWSTVPFGVHLGDVKLPNARMVDCVVEPTFLNAPFGQVKHALLTLEALVFTLQRPQNKPPTCPGGDQCSCDRRYSRVCVPGKGNRLPSGEIMLDFDWSKPGLEDLRLVFLGWTDFVGHEATFLVVEKLPRGRYRRVGRAILKDDSQQRMRNFLVSRPRELVSIE
ncbi:HET-domain-containing protein [Mollisia scopiformis]|uniref:HET-domain-containing protein n=1 Tax=Mollisia scopiformis TaxID=149040 RepID=A0A194XII5_MOLSC|nr:HET-domain-containing protein [Mollisia scopiformis]KUJ19941.1 HET-domain-containing protein [Mollisia scopiformis]